MLVKMNCHVSEENIFISVGSGKLCYRECKKNIYVDDSKIVGSEAYLLGNMS